MRSADPTGVDLELEVFAVEDRAIQVAWACLPGPDLTLEVAGQEVPVGRPPEPWYQLTGKRLLPSRWAGPGAVTVDGLTPGTRYDVTLTGPGLPRRRVATATTLPPPPGRSLGRFATISDCHIGERQVGWIRPLRDPDPKPPDLVRYPERCARAALHEAARWGAELMVAKGDLTQRTGPDELYRVGSLLVDGPLPVEAVLGNHDVRGVLDAAAVLRSTGLSVTTQPRALEVAGTRLLFGHSPIQGVHRGLVIDDDQAALASLAAEPRQPGRGNVVVLHHPPQRWAVETKYPPSIYRDNGNQLIAALAAANPATLIVAGHTHRNRRYRVGGLTVSEVGATKDYPGQWAGYEVYEGGIRQVVFRVEAPEAIGWTQMTKRALKGIWGWWSPGRLGDRCWTLEWPARIVTAPAPWAPAGSSG